LLWLAATPVGLSGLVLGGIENLLFLGGTALFGLGYIFFGIGMLKKSAATVYILNA